MHARTPHMWSRIKTRVTIAPLAEFNKKIYKHHSQLRQFIFVWLKPHPAALGCCRVCCVCGFALLCSHSTAPRTSRATRAHKTHKTIEDDHLHKERYVLSEVYVYAPQVAIFRRRTKRNTCCGCEIIHWVLWTRALDLWMRRISSLSSYTSISDTVSVHSQREMAKRKRKVSQKVSTADEGLPPAILLGLRALLQLLLYAADIGGHRGTIDNHYTRRLRKWHYPFMLWATQTAQFSRLG